MIFYFCSIIIYSMIYENIKNGDVVLIKQQDTAGKKQIITIIDAENDKIRLRCLKKRVEKIKIFLLTLYIKERCQICHQKQDVDGRCSCVNKDAW